MFYTCQCITLLWLLSWDYVNWRSMLPCWRVSSCSDHCHETIITDWACFIPDGCITMLWVFSWDDDNWRGMFNTLGIKNHALIVVMRRWKMMEHVSYLRGCHHVLPLSWDDDSWWSMFHIWWAYQHALTFIMRPWQLKKHVSYLREISPCSDRCHEMIITDGACFISEGVSPCSNGWHKRTTSEGACS